MATPTVNPPNTGGASSHRTLRMHHPPAEGGARHWAKARPRKHNRPTALSVDPPPGLPPPESISQISILNSGGGPLRALSGRRSTTHCNTTHSLGLPNPIVPSTSAALRSKQHTQANAYRRIQPTLDGHAIRRTCSPSAEAEQHPPRNGVSDANSIEVSEHCISHRSKGTTVATRSTPTTPYRISGHRVQVLVMQTWSH